MNQTLNELLATLDDEVKGYQDVQVLLKKEKAAATLSKSDHLVRIGMDKQSIVQAIGKMEARRRALVEKMAAEYGLEGSSITVSTLSRYLEPPHDARLKAVAHDLKSLIESVRRENNANAKLFSHYLDLIHGSLKLLNDLVYSYAVYQKPGSENRTPGYGGGRGKVFCGSV